MELFAETIGRRLESGDHALRLDTRHPNESASAHEDVLGGLEASSREALTFHLSQRFHLEWKDVAEQPHEFARALFSLLGEGARILVTKMIDNLTRVSAARANDDIVLGMIRCLELVGRMLDSVNHITLVA